MIHLILNAFCSNKKKKKNLKQQKENIYLQRLKGC